MSTQAHPEKMSQTIQPGATRRRARLFNMLTLVLIVLLLKLGLTAGRILWSSAENYLPAFPEEVLAGDRKPKSQAQDAAPQTKNPAPHPTATPSTVSTVPTATPAMTDMVTHLEQREAEVKKKEEQLRQKEDYLAKMEQEVEKKLKELMGIQKEIQTYRAEKEEGQSAKIRSLAKIYGTMKPKEAAKLLDNLDEQLVVSVIATMTADEAGNILSNMDVKKAAKISESLSHK